MEYEAYSPSTPQALRALSREHGDKQVLSQLDPKELRKSPSKWDIRHLIAYRLLVTPAQPFLPILVPHHDDQCPLCTQQGPFHGQQPRHEAGAYALVGETPRNLGEKREHELVALPAGSFWIALARASLPEPTQLPKAYPQRERKQAQREGYVNSRDAIPGSSSPADSFSSSDFSMSNSVDDDEHEARRSKPEEVTVHLITSFLQHALQLFHLEHPASFDANTDFRPRVERMMTTTHVAGDTAITAEDDGGISKLRWRAGSWVTVHPYLALLEAKRAFKSIQFDDRTGDHTSVVSNEILAQCLGEAIIAWKENPDLLRDDVFLVAATNTFMRLIHFWFGGNYREYLDAAGSGPQSQVANDEDKDAFAYMASTRWFNLQSPQGRRSALCCIAASLRRHVANDSIRTSDGDDEGDDSDYSM